MWVARYFFVGCFAALVLAAMQIWAMAETIERAELRLMPMVALPVHFKELTPASDRLAAVIDEIKSEHGAAYCWALLMREAARVKTDEQNAKVRKAEEDLHVAAIDRG